MCLKICHLQYILLVISIPSQTDGKHVFKVLQRMLITRISGAVHKSTEDIRNMMLGRHIIYCPNSESCKSESCMHMLLSIKTTTGNASTQTIC